MGYKDCEKQKQYNKEYHEKNKQKLEEQLGRKVECQFCKRTVRYQNLFKHQKTKYCTDRRAFNAMIEKEKEDMQLSQP